MRKILLACLLGVTTFSLHAQNVNIPDANFKAALTANPTINTNMDAEIQETEASAYAGVLDVSNQGITDLTGIEAFTALSELNCSSNSLTTLDLTANTALTELRCYSNQLTTLDLSANTLLENVNCLGNQLTTLDLSDHTALLDLECGNNQLTALNLNNCSALSTLSVSGNDLSSIDLSTNTSLTSLSINQNNLTSLDVTNNTLLTYISASYNQLTALDVSNNTNLLTLQLYDNVTLASLDVSGNPSLTSLLASGNALTTIDVTNNTMLTHLNVRMNNLTSLNVSNNTDLISLVCGSNQLTSLDVTALTSLEALECDYNELTSLDVSMNSGLTSLNFRSNEITTIDLSNNTSLNYLTIGSNQLTSLDLSPLIDLINLYVDDNQLTSLDLTANISLNFVDARTNLLSSLNVTGLTALTNLYCNHNLLTTLDVSTNPGLSLLDCQDNLITSLDLSSNTNLSTLYCNNNPELTSLNLKNGNNENMSNFGFYANGNFNLPCIEVDNPSYASATWTNVVTGVTFDTDCSVTTVDLGDSLYVLQANNFNAQDAHISENNPDENFDEQALYFGGNFGSGSRAMLLDFDMTILSSATVNEVRIDLYQEGLNGFINSFDYGVYEITEPWSEDTVTWNNRPTVDSTLITTILGEVWDDDYLLWRSLEFPESMVQNWIDNPTENYGFMILPIADSYGYPYITSSESTINEPFHPKIVINSQGVMLAGQVTDQSTSDPVSDIVISVFERSTKRLVSRDTTDATGDYLIDVGFPGNYDIKVDGISGYLPHSLDSLIVPEDTILVNNIELVPNGNAISGEVSGTWTQAESPYVIVGDVLVSPGNSLIIEPGVEVQFAGRYSLTVNGSLTAVGTATDSIKFTAYDTTMYAKGGGVRFESSNSFNNVISHCIFEYGLANDNIPGGSFDDYGAGVFCYNSSITIRNSDFRYNEAMQGGAVYINSNNDVRVSNNLIRNNHTYYDASTTGGAITAVSYQENKVIVESNLIIHNTSQTLNPSNQEGGGGARLEGEVLFANNIVYKNHGIKGSGIYILERANVYNNAIWNNYGSLNGEQLAIGYYDGASEVSADLNIHNNSIPDTAIAVLIRDLEAGFSYDNGVGNTGVDPLFVDSTNLDFHLQAGSPLIDAGNSEIYQNFDYDLVDYDLNDRLFEVSTVADVGTGSQPLPDIGLYEFQSIRKISDFISEFAEPERVELSWTDNTSDETGFEISRSFYQDSLFTVLDTLDPDIVNYSDTLSSPEGLLYYRIRTFTANGFGSYAKAEAVDESNTVDSLALVALYNSTDGPNWIDNTGWLTDSLKNWFGVTLENNKVTELALINNGLNGTIPPEIGDFQNIRLLRLRSNQQLSGNIPPELGNLTSLTDQLDLGINNLSGEIPPELGNLVNLERLYLFNNALTGPVPSSFENLMNIQYLPIQNNQIDELPDLTSLPSILEFNVSGNKLTFDDLEPNLGITGFMYVPQKEVGIPQDTLVNINDSPVFEAMPGGSGNTYVWFKDGEVIDGESGESLSLQNVDFPDEGEFYFEATNPVVTGLTLRGAPITLKVSSLERDSLVLHQLYTSAGGVDWTDAANWTTGNLETWEGVDIDNNRVIGLNISGKNVSGTIPADVTDIVNMETIDLSNNSIVSIPDMSKMASLTSLNVSGNLLEFDDLETNISISNFEYSSQGLIGSESRELLPRGSDYTVSITTPGNALSYQWKRNEQEISGATMSDFEIDSIHYQNMGVFTVDVTSGIVPNLVLTSHPMEVLATSPISITVIGQDDLLFQEGEGHLLIIGEPGMPFDTVDTQSPVEGEFVFETTVLGDYLVAIVPEDTTTYLPTYYENTFLWEEADTLRFREGIEDTIYMTIRPVPPGPDDGDYSLHGIVESDFPEDSRIEARKRIKRTGCSVRRFRSAGRGEDGIWELVAYVYTDDNGEFNFDFLPPDVYRFNVEYPGIPMDPESFVEFELGGGDKPRFKTELLATVSPEGVVVEEIPPLGVSPAKGLSVYPSPADQWIRIEWVSKTSDLQIRVVNLNGKTVFQKEITESGQSYHLNTSHFNNGLYFLTIQGEEDGEIAKYKIYINHR